MAKQLSGEEEKIILHAGDFGIWPEEEKYEWMGKTMYRQTYLQAVTDALEAEDAYLWFVDGNHENHPYLKELALKYEMQFGKAVKDFESAADYGVDRPENPVAAPENEMGMASPDLARSRRGCLCR